MNQETLTLKQLAEIFNVSPQAMCRSLAEIGISDADGKPVQSAVRIGVAGSVHARVWVREAVIAVLEAAGYNRRPLPLPPAVKPQGPFIARRGHPEADGFEIVDANGAVSLWCRGEWLSCVVVRLLNVAWITRRWFI